MSKGVIVDDRWCFDTDVLIDVSRKKAAAVAFLAQKEKDGEVCCLIVSKFELSGARNKKEQTTIVDFHRNLLHPKLIFLADRPAHCPRCKQDLEETEIQYVTLHNGRLVVNRDVPALRCRANGHEYMLEKILDQVEQLLNLEKTQKLQPAEMIHVPVFKLGMAA